MRAALIILALATAQPVGAWEFSPSPVCTLRHEGSEGDVTLTWDPLRDHAYAITVTRNSAWVDGPVFAISFQGNRGLTISTQRHVLSEDRTSLTVTDQGFGNVLDGLEFNDRAVADLGGSQVTFGLEDAAGPVRDFRACTEAAVASLQPEGSRSVSAASPSPA